ncbi:hypothetical protein [Pelosinus propionicus]|uniref:Uncharacterized protein n=1 Tax=Pelosinus propionicus DSM 13327 TaxID=1123291 RepID=A0A1I4H7V9_9FIRM|nr:hypothetical protein [Pelosinus propionicus]SFL38324.1 hypothetical protein SAMN04490355_100323 [Pelosinus propionicus DSM 13327]
MRRFNRTFDWNVKWSKKNYPDRTNEWDKQQQALKNLKTIDILLPSLDKEGKTSKH